MSTTAVVVCLLKFVSAKTRLAHLPPLRSSGTGGSASAGTWAQDTPKTARACRCHLIPEEAVREVLTGCCATGGSLHQEQESMERRRGRVSRPLVFHTHNQRSSDKHAQLGKIFSLFFSLLFFP
jgi:hypothetical protein